MVRGRQVIVAIAATQRGFTEDQTASQIIASQIVEYWGVTVFCVVTLAQS